MNKLPWSDEASPRTEAGIFMFGGCVVTDPKLTRSLEKRLRAAEGLLRTNPAFMMGEWADAVTAHLEAARQEDENASL